MTRSALLFIAPRGHHVSQSANQDPGLQTMDQSEPLMILTLICLLDPPSEFQIQDITRTRNVDNTNWQMDAALLMLKHQDNPALSI